MEKITSIKKKLGKRFRLVWGILAICLAGILIFSFIDYCNYKKGQETAVECMLQLTNRFNNNKDHKLLVEEMYDFFHQRSYSFNGKLYNNSATDTNRALGGMLETLGYPCLYGSEYLRYTSFIDFVQANISIFGIWDLYTVCCIVWSCFVIILLILNLLYVIDKRKTVTVCSDKIICYIGTKPVKEFFVKDIKSVELAFLKGLKIRGNGIKYKINLLKNADELKTSIMDKLSAIPQENLISDNASNADELKKFKDLLDSGVITQVEFDAKKKQILEL